MASEVARVARRLEAAKETQFLDLSRCELLKIPDAAYLMLKDITIVKCDLSANQIKNIPSKFCMKFPSLTELDCHGNKITTLPAEIRDLEQLTTIDLSQNKLESIPDILYDCPRLQTIKVANNTIKEVNIDTLSKMSSLQELDLQDNPLSEDCQSALASIDSLIIHTGVSDPKGQELDAVD